jgi:serine/threonine protein kinase
MSEVLIQGQCPGCGKTLRVGGHLLGRKVKCRGCNTAFLIAGPDGEVADGTASVSTIEGSAPESEPAAAPAPAAPSPAPSPKTRIGIITPAPAGFTGGTIVMDPVGPDELVAPPSKPPTGKTPAVRPDAKPSAKPAPAPATATATAKAPPKVAPPGGSSSAHMAMGRGGGGNPAVRTPTLPLTGIPAKPGKGGKPSADAGGASKTGLPPAKPAPTARNSSAVLNPPSRAGAGASGRGRGGPAIPDTPSGRLAVLDAASGASSGGRSAGPSAGELAIDLDEGARLGQFAVVRTLGRGTSGAVYHAHDTVLERDVAIKVLPAAVSEGGPDALAEFLRQANISSPIEHAHVNSVYQAGRAGDACFFAVEFCPGGSVADYVSRKGRLTPADAARVIAQAARGLAAAHSGGLVHGNIRPENVLLGEDWTAKIADTGLRAALERCGLVPDDAPAEYFCPEQCAGQGGGPRGDLYSLGAVLFFTLTGRPPFRGTRNAVMAGHLRSDPPDPRTVASDIPDDLAALVQKALAKRPADRFASAAEMASELEAVWARLSPKEAGSQTRLKSIVTTGMIPLGPSAAPKTAPLPRRPADWSAWRTPMIVAGVVAALLVLGTGAAWMLRGKGTPKGGAGGSGGAAGTDGAGRPGDAGSNSAAEGDAAVERLATLSGEGGTYRPAATLTGTLHNIVEGQGRTDPDGMLDSLEKPRRPAKRPGGSPNGGSAQGTTAPPHGHNHEGPPNCPVTGKPGRPAISEGHNGMRWKFCSEECRQKFLRDPDRYANNPAPPAKP